VLLRAAAAALRRVEWPANTPDTDFDDDDKDIKSSLKPHEIEFKAIGPQDIRVAQDKHIEVVALILGLPTETCAILLRYFHWNKDRLIESYMDRPEQVLENAGFGPSSDGPPKTRILPGFFCEICCEDEPGMQTYAMKCGHRFCVDCYRQYLSHKIKDEGEAARIQCPKEGCSRIVDSKSLDLMISGDLHDR